MRGHRSHGQKRLGIKANIRSDWWMNKTVVPRQ